MKESLHIICGNWSRYIHKYSRTGPLPIRTSAYFPLVCFILQRCLRQLDQDRIHSSKRSASCHANLYIFFTLPSCNVDADTAVLRNTELYKSEYLHLASGCVGGGGILYHSSLQSAYQFGIGLPTLAMINLLSLCMADSTRNYASNCGTTSQRVVPAPPRTTYLA